MHLFRDRRELRLEAEYYDFAQWAGVTRDVARQHLRASSGTRWPSEDQITYAGDRLAELTASGDIPSRGSRRR
jgi:hypothetical protein